MVVMVLQRAKAVAELFDHSRLMQQLYFELMLLLDTIIILSQMPSNIGDMVVSGRKEQIWNNHVGLSVYQ